MDRYDVFKTAIALYSNSSIRTKCIITIILLLATVLSLCIPNYFYGMYCTTLREPPWTTRRESITLFAREQNIKYICIITNTFTIRRHAPTWDAYNNIIMNAFDKTK